MGHHPVEEEEDNCPVCRADIKQMASCKVLDEYTDKLYDQFVPEGGKQQRKFLKEEREKIKKDEENAAQVEMTLSLHLNRGHMNKRQDFKQGEKGPRQEGLEGLKWLIL